MTTFQSLGANLPAVAIEIDFENDPTSASYTWVDVTPYVRGFQIKRGRDSALSRPNAGSLQLTLSNADGRFDPTNTAGAYSPDVLPMRRIHALAQWAGVTYNLFTGYILDWPVGFDPSNRDSTVQVQAADAFAILDTFDLVGKNYSAELSSTRVQNVLSDCGIGSALWDISTGQSTMVASGTIATGTTATAHLLDVMASENGFVYPDAGGTIRFQDRHFRIKNRATSSGTVGTGGGLIGYRDIRTSYGVGEIWNVIQVTANGGTAETVTDAASTASYFKRVLAWPTGGQYLVTSQAEALSAAQYMGYLYAEPALRVPEVAVVAAGATANWGTVLAVEISDRLTVNHVAPWGGTISGDKHIESIEHDVKFDREWDTRYLMSDASSQTFWVLGSSTNSLLGSTTYLSY